MKTESDPRAGDGGVPTQEQVIRAASTATQEPAAERYVCAGCGGHVVPIVTSCVLDSGTNWTCPTCGAQTVVSLAAALSAEPATQEQDRLNWRTCGIIELAVRNPNVASYMEHWEGRALKAEAALADRDARLRTLEQQMREAVETTPNSDPQRLRLAVSSHEALKWADTIAALLRHEGEQPSIDSPYTVDYAMDQVERDLATLLRQGTKEPKS